MKDKRFRFVFISFLALCFLMAQALPVVAVSVRRSCAAMTSGQETINQSKDGCCCCDASHCPCDLKKGEANLPTSSDLAFDAKVGYQSFEEAGIPCKTFNGLFSDDIAPTTFWTFARAPCPTIYLSTLNLLC